MANSNDGLISFTDSEVKDGYLVQTPGWAKFKALSYRKNRAASGESDNYFVEVKILSSESDPNLNDVEFTKMFNTTKGFKPYIRKFMEACNGGKEILPNQNYNFDDCMGVEIEGYVQRGADKNGQPINDISSFRPVQS